MSSKPASSNVEGLNDLKMHDCILMHFDRIV